MQSIISESLGRLRTPFVEVNQATYYQPTIYERYEVGRKNANGRLVLCGLGKTLTGRDPYKNSRLFSEFSGINSQEKALEFVRKNGFLLSEHNQIIITDAMAIEDLDFILSEAHQAHLLRNLLNMILRNDIKKIKSLLVFKFKRPLGKNKPDELQSIQSGLRGECSFHITFDGNEWMPPHDTINVFNAFEPSKYLDFAYFFLVLKIIEKLSQIKLDFFNLIPSSGSRIKYKPIPAYSFENLIDVMYFSFYAMLCNGIDVYTCKYCGSEFAPERKNVRYCPECLANYGDNIYEFARRKAKKGGSNQ